MALFGIGTRNLFSQPSRIGFTRVGIPIECHRFAVGRRTSDFIVPDAGGTRTSSLAARLEQDADSPTVTAFPDGSVDSFYHVS